MTPGGVTCPNGHAVNAVDRFCTECGVPLVTPGSGAAPTPNPALPPWQTPSPTSASRPAWASPPPGYSQVPPSRGANGMAIASMVLGIVWVWWVGSILAFTFGLIALRQIRERNESGRGMAIAGIVLGSIGVGILIVVIVLAAVGATHPNTRINVQ